MTTTTAPTTCGALIDDGADDFGVQVMGAEYCDDEPGDCDHVTAEDLRAAHDRAERRLTALNAGAEAAYAAEVYTPAVLVELDVAVREARQKWLDALRAMNHNEGRCPSRRR